MSGPDEQLDMVEVRKILLQRDFEAVGKSPRRWRGMASSLKRAADLLYAADVKHSDEDASLRSWSSLIVYTGLVGMALEVAAKGIRAWTDPEFVRGDGRTKPSHNVREIVERVITLNDDEKELCDRLKISVMWHGRYPVPLECSDLTKGHRHWTIPKDLITADRLFTRVLHRLTECCNEAAVAQNVAPPESLIQ